MRLDRYIRWWFETPFMRPWGHSSNTLFAGPWVGEFGWELMSWQGLVRSLSSRYERVIVSCRKGHEPLYEDFASEFVTHEIQGRGDGEWAEISNWDEYDRVLRRVPLHADRLPPVGRVREPNQRFVRFGNQQADLQTDLVFHARGRVHGNYRNWTSESWDQLLEVWRARGYRVGCIGTRDATQNVAGNFIDYRGADLGKTMNVIASTKLVVGPSSGPMHLSSLCGTPHLVWTDKKLYAGFTRSRDRYERIWNPLGTPAYVFDEHGFNPPPRLVAQWTDEIFMNSRTKKTRMGEESASTAIV